MTILSALKALVGQKESEHAVTVETDDDEYDYDDDLDFVGEDEWEDGPAIERIKAKYPEGWMVVKVVNFTEHTLRDVKEWCEANCEHPYDQVGWDSGCSYTVGVIFSNATDAVMFKLTWGTK